MEPCLRCEMNLTGLTTKKRGGGDVPRSNAHLSRECRNRMMAQEAVVLYVAWYVRI